MQVSEQTSTGVDKVSRYGWKTKDEQGRLMMVNKELLQVDPRYQRDALPQKVADITARWSWVACGALVVALRDGEYWVIDGQHRALAAKRRSDIEALPCVVFRTEDERQEARGFLDLNTGRKPVSSFAKQRAMAAAGDELAEFVQETCESLGLAIRPTAHAPMQIQCVAWAMRRAASNREDFAQVLKLATEICAADEMPVLERIAEGLWQLHTRCGDGLDDARLERRIREKGARLLLDAANRAAAFYAHGGGRVWAQGMLNEINKGLRSKFSMGGDEE